MKCFLSANSRGQILVIALVFVAVTILMMVGAVGYSSVNSTAAEHSYVREQALAIAEGGLEAAISKLNQDANYAGESGQALGPGSYTTSVTTINQFTKRVTSVGKVKYRNNEEAVRTVAATAQIDQEKVAFAYGVQVGEGGFVMDNNSVVNGNVFSNSSLSGSGKITGNATVATGASTTADQSVTTQNTDFIFAKLASQRDAAQNFTPTISEKLTGLKVLLKKVGNPGNLTVKIVADNNGVPSKTVLASGSISASLVTVNYSMAPVALGSNPALQASVKYWVILVGFVNSSNYYSWGMDNAVDSGKYSSDWDDKSPAWNASGGAFNYETYLGGEQTFLSGITVNGTTRATKILSCDIGGDAYFEVQNTCTVSGTVYAGVPAPPPQPWPISAAQIIEWENVVAASRIIYGDYTVDGDDSSATLGPTKIEGDLKVNNGAMLYLLGPLWVNGNILVDNNAQILVHSSLGPTGVVLIADYPADTALAGIITVGNNAVIAGNGQPGSYALVISTYSGDDNAVNLNNNAENSIFYAPYGKIDLSNNVGVKALTAYSVHFNNNASVSYESGLQHTTFTNGPGGSWVFVTGTYAILP